MGHVPYANESVMETKEMIAECYISCTKLAGVTRKESKTSVPLFTSPSQDDEENTSRGYNILKLNRFFESPFVCNLPTVWL
jgi:hypothetical protein